MLLTLAGITKLVRPQAMNASSPMLVMLSGIVTLVKLSLNLNASSAMPVTGRLLIVAGIVTAPPGPV